jgi:hypothetical protein
MSDPDRLAESGGRHPYEYDGGEDGHCRRCGGWPNDLRHSPPPPPPDRLAEIKARRAGVPTEPLEVIVTPTEEEYYMRWRILEYGPRDRWGGRSRFAWIPEEDETVAEFVAHAPADIDWLVAECERLREENRGLRAFAEDHPDY